MKSLAKAISFILSPVFLTFPAFFLLIAKFSQDYSHALKWTLFSYAFILVVALFVIVGVMLGAFTNFDVSKREQRPLLFSFSAFVAFCYLVSLLILDAPKVLFVGFFAIMLGLVSIIIINRWIKASIHMATATSVFLLVGIIYGGYFYFLLLFAPLLAWSRIKMREHTLPETIIGTILGIVITLIVYLIGKQFLMGIIYS